MLFVKTGFEGTERTLYVGSMGTIGEWRSNEPTQAAGLPLRVPSLPQTWAAPVGWAGRVALGSVGAALTQHRYTVA